MGQCNWNGIYKILLVPGYISLAFDKIPVKVVLLFLLLLLLLLFHMWHNCNCDVLPILVRSCFSLKPSFTLGLTLNHPIHLLNWLLWLLSFFFFIWLQCKASLWTTIVIDVGYKVGGAAASNSSSWKRGFYPEYVLYTVFHTLCPIMIFAVFLAVILKPSFITVYHCEMPGIADNQAGVHQIGVFCPTRQIASHQFRHAALFTSHLNRVSLVGRGCDKWCLLKTGWWCWV